jgi:mono/diheme cytochrome c family protein
LKEICVFTVVLFLIVLSGCIGGTSQSPPEINLVTEEPIATTLPPSQPPLTSDPTVTSAPTIEPPIKEGIPTLTIKNIPSTVSEISQIEILWAVSGEGMRSSHNEIHYGSKSNPGTYGTDVESLEGYSSLTTEFSNGVFQLPMDFLTTITPEGPGTIYVRAHTKINEKNYWSEEKEIIVHTEEEHHEEEHTVPEEARDLVNPISSSESSLARGKDLYTKNCVSCHGPEGRGDGHMAMMLSPRPSNLHDAHVQENSDGVLFYIISNGEEDTAMPAFTLISEDDRWHIVNYLRTFEQEENGADGHEHAEGEEDLHE